MLAYGTSAASAGVRFVAVVDPVASRRRAFAAQHGIGEDHQFTSVGQWLDGPRLAPAAVVATPDDQHVAPTVAALEAGHHVLLEKPMAQTIGECLTLIETAQRVGRQLHVCHVLRYTGFFRAVREIVASGRLGRIVTVEHRENVDARHMAHSYVRGAYRRVDGSNPMVLAKCSHDLDLLHWILDDPVVRVASFGSLTHFRPESVGPEIPDRCVDGCPIEATCTFSALRAYAPEVPVAEPGIRVLTQLIPLTDPPTHDRESRLAALATSPYGRCVYRADNDVVDHQVAVMELASGTSVSFTMHGHSHEEGRTMRYDGTEATLRARFTDHPEITVHDHGTDRAETVDLGATGSALDHGGGDPAILAAFARSLGAADDRGASVVGGLVSDARDSLESHVLAFALEEARLSGAVVDLDAYRARHGVRRPTPVPSTTKG
jgi:predicted dehydrogenase